MEVWKDIPSYAGLYQASDQGNVRKLFKPVKKWDGSTVNGGYRIISPWIDRTGRQQVSLNKDGKKKNYQVHRAVMEAFVGLRPEGMECCHNDGNPLNNVLSNLRWDTHINNELDKLSHNTMQLGEDHYNSKLTKDNVINIRSMVRDGVPYKEIYKLFNTAPRTIRDVINGKTWKHVD